MDTKKKPPESPPETLEQTYAKVLTKAYQNDLYWLKYLDGMDWQIVSAIGKETLEQTRDRRNQAAVIGAYRDALKTRTEEEALSFVMEAIESVKTVEYYDLWTKEHVARMEKDQDEREE